jgi:serine/threonine-protein kinase
MDFPGAPRSSRENEPAGIVLTRTSVLTVSQRVIARADRSPTEQGRELSSGLAVAGGAVVLRGLRAEERLLMGLVDGRLSVARLARLSGLSEEATIKNLRALCARRMLVAVEAQEVTIRGTSGDPAFRLGPYEVASKIGQGGMGSVYVCRRTGAVGFRRRFAVKVVRQDTGQEQVAERSFLREVRVGSLLDHPNTQAVYDVGTYKNQPYLVLQFIEGINLEEASFGRPMPPEILVTILLDVLRGLNGAHDLMDEDGRWLGLVHGDVSPPNILIGVDGVSRLTDFGSTRFTALGESGKADPTNIGKPAFMSPEQLASEPLDRRSDLFALGAVMWTGLTGQDLFSADSYEQILVNVLQKEVPPPSTFGAPACLDEICLRALGRAREQRYGSADEMAEALVKTAVANGLLAPPAAVGAFVRRQMSGAGGDRLKWIESMLPSGPLAPERATGPVPPVQPVTSDVGPMAPIGPAGPEPAEKKFTKTMIIPAVPAPGRPELAAALRALAGKVGTQIIPKIRESGVWIVVALALLVFTAITAMLARRDEGKRASRAEAAPASASEAPRGDQSPEEHPPGVAPAATAAPRTSGTAGSPDPSCETAPGQPSGAAPFCASQLGASPSARPPTSSVDVPR